MKANTTTLSFPPAPVKYTVGEVAQLARLEQKRLARLAADGQRTAPVGVTAWANFMAAVVAIADEAALQDATSRAA